MFLKNSSGNNFCLLPPVHRPTPQRGRRHSLLSFITSPSTSDKRPHQANCFSNQCSFIMEINNNFHRCVCQNPECFETQAQAALHDLLVDNIPAATFGVCSSHPCTSPHTIVHQTAFGLYDSLLATHLSVSNLTKDSIMQYYQFLLFAVRSMH